MKYGILLIAFILDFIQFLLGIAFIAFQFITPAGGAVVGAAAGGLFCYNSSTGVVSGVINGIACALGGALAGAGVSLFATPIGAVIDVALSITIGSAIIALLAFAGMFYPRVVITGFVWEVMPFLSFLPVWTRMVWKCIQQSKTQTNLSSATMGGAIGFITGSAMSAIPGGSLIKSASSVASKRTATPTNTTQTPSEPATQKASRAPLLNRFTPDIRRGIRGSAFAILLLLGSVAHAQTVPDPIQYVISPETPGAHEAVLIEVQGVGSFLGSANITWKQDGRVVKTGVAERSLIFTTAGLGERTTISVAIDSSQGYFTKTFVFNPSRINLVWEADTTIPPFFRGKALYSGGSTYTVVAFPTVYSGSSRITAGALTYQWQYKGDIVPEQSGLGRYIFGKTGDQLQSSEDIAVEVYYGTAKVGYAEISIPASDPFVLLYQRDTLRGVLYDQVMPAAIALTGKEITLQAEPFYFSSATKKSGLIPFVWTLNDEETSGPDSSSGILTLRQGGVGVGVASVGITMQNNNPEQFVQIANNLLQIQFGADQKNQIQNFLGL